jgi:hypothetical protein
MNEHNLPVELSIDAKENAFCHYCPQVGHFKNYAVCNHLIDKRKQGRLSAMYEECSVSISKKTCPAIKMRKQELEEGRSIHFISRKALQDASNIRDSNIVQRAAVVASKRSKSTVNNVVPMERPSTPVPKKEETFASMDYAAVISTAAKESPKPVSKPTATALKPEQGESMIDFAKRMMNARKAS